MDIDPEVRRNAPLHPGSAVLRRALRQNLISFPSQVPGFLKHPPADVQCRIVLLFFVRGWSAPDIGLRLKLPKHRIWEVLNDWSIRALALGYIQVIDGEAFASVCRFDEAHVEGEESHDLHYGFEQLTNPVADALRAATLPGLSNLSNCGVLPVDRAEIGADLTTIIEAALVACEQSRDPAAVHAAAVVRGLCAAAGREVALQSEGMEPAGASAAVGRSSPRNVLCGYDSERPSHAIR